MTRRSRALGVLGVLLTLTMALGADGGLPTARPRSALAAPDSSVVLAPFVAGLSNPVLITHAGDDSGRLFVVERGGLIKIVTNGQVIATPFLDVSSRVVAGGEQGLLGLVFHPRYQTNGRFFIFYTAKPPAGQPCPGNCGNNTLAEYHVDENNPNIANPVPVRILFSLPDEFANHNGGMLGFSPVDPDHAYLYVGTGDEGSGGDPKGNAQNLGSLYGKILRLDVDNIPTGQTYGIPPSNPFVGQTGARPEIWAYGFRNPWRWSFDRLTGDQFIGDVGQGAWEEIDRIPSLLTGQAGRNFGWNICEGAHTYAPNGPCSSPSLVNPILEYGHGLGCSVTGGYRYRGSVSPTLQGLYFYADFCSGRIWKGIQSGSSWSAVEALDTTHSIASFGEDQSGELYVVALGGTIFRIHQAPATTPTPSCSNRPYVTVQATRTGPGFLSVFVGANDGGSVADNELHSVSFTSISNAFVTMGNEVNRTTPFTVTPAAGTKTATFTVDRNVDGQPMTVRLIITDRCGPWPTFVGGGASMP